MAEFFLEVGIMNYCLIYDKVSAKEAFLFYLTGVFYLKMCKFWDVSFLTDTFPADFADFWDFF
jgi:hypothetical protein